MWRKGKFFYTSRMENKEEDTSEGTGNSDWG